MRRIDLLCKLLGPLFIALIDGSSTRIAIIVNFAMNIASVPVEYIAIARVYREVPELQKPKHTHTTNEDGIETRNAPNLLQRMLYPLQKSITDFILYVRHRAFLPSFAGALLYLTVLNFGGQMVTFLLASGYKSSIIGIARTLSVACEVSATWIGPWLMSKIGPIRAGLWLSICQLTPLIAGTACYFALHQYPVYAASALVAGTIVSRIGLRGFDLSTQLIVQEVSGSLGWSDVEPNTNAVDKGRGGRLPRSFLRRRSCMAKCSRATFICDHYRLLRSESVSDSSRDFNQRSWTRHLLIHHLRIPKARPPYPHRQVLETHLDHWQQLQEGSQQLIANDGRSNCD